MALEKLRIKPLPPSALPEISVLFNPNAYTIVKPVTWSVPQASSGSGGQTDRAVNAQPLVFGGGGSHRRSNCSSTSPADQRRADRRRRTLTNAIVADADRVEAGPSAGLRDLVGTAR
jgi:hypothetical protein